MSVETGFKPEFEKWLSKMCYRACSNEKVIRQHRKNEIIFYRNWPPQDARTPLWLKARVEMKVRRTR